MADVKISALPAATTPLAGTEVLPIVQSSTTKKVAISDVTAGRAISASSLTLTTPLAVGSGGTGLSSLTAGYIPFGAGTSAFGNDSNLFWDNSNTRLGIGTATPSEKLNIKSSTTTCVRAETSSTTSQVYFNAVSSSGTSTQLTTIGPSQASYGILTAGTSVIYSNSSAGLAIGTDAAGPIMFYTNSAASERMRIASDGSVGIGTTSPASRLSIDAPRSDTAGTGWLRLTEISQTGGRWAQRVSTGNTYCFDYYNGASWSNYLNIDSSGNLLVGTQTQVQSALVNFRRTAATAVSNGRVLHLTNEGTPGSTSPCGMTIDYTVAAGGNGSTFIECTDSTTARFYVLGSGNCQNANNSYGAISDVSVKENIIDATPKLDDLLKVKVRHFNLKNDDVSAKQIGVIAQELETIFPGMIEMNTDGLKGVKYSVFTPMLIKAIQELAAKVQALEVKVQ